MHDSINLQKYANLLVETLPFAVENAEDHEKTVAKIAKLMRKENLSPEETEMLRLLSVLAADYEKKTVSLEPLAPHVFLQTLLEDNKMRQKDLLPIFKTEAAVSEVLRGKRAITKKKAEQLADIFHISYKFFL